MKRHEHTVVVLGCWHLVEVTVCVESQQPSLLAQDSPPVVQVPLVTHNHYGDFVCVQVVFVGLDGVNEPAEGVETDSVTDAVDQDVGICPLDFLFKEWHLCRWRLWNKLIAVTLQIEMLNIKTNPLINYNVCIYVMIYFCKKSQHSPSIFTSEYGESQIFRVISLPSTTQLWL